MKDTGEVSFQECPERSAPFDAKPGHSHPRRAACAEHQFGQGPDQRIGAVGRAPGAQIGTSGDQPAHFVFQRREQTGMTDPSGFVERGDRLGAGDFAPAGVNQPQRQGKLRRAQHRADLVGLGHYAVGLPGLGAGSWGMIPAVDV
jgi:hypothetical protein